MAIKQEAIVFQASPLGLPVVLLSLAFTLVYSFLNWLLVARTGWIPLDQDILDWWLPAGLAWILVIVLIQPRLHWLKIPKESDRLRDLYHIVAVASVAVPALIAQGYVRTATGDLTHVEDADLIATSPLSKFYTADHVCMHLIRPVSKPFVTVSGRHNETLDFDLYVIAHICSNRGAYVHEELARTIIEASPMAWPMPRRRKPSIHLFENHSRHSMRKTRKSINISKTSATTWIESALRRHCRRMPITCRLPSYSSGTRSRLGSGAAIDSCGCRSRFLAFRSSG